LQELHLPDWQLITTAGNIEENLLEVFADILPARLSSAALANATEVYQYIYCILTNLPYHFL